MNEVVNVKGIEIELGKHYPEFNEQELSVLPQKDWIGNDKWWMIWQDDETGELYWEFDEDAD